MLTRSGHQNWKYKSKFRTMAGSVSYLEFWGMVRDKEDWHAAALGVEKRLAVEQQQEVLQRFK